MKDVATLLLVLLLSLNITPLSAQNIPEPLDFTMQEMGEYNDEVLKHFLEWDFNYVANQFPDSYSIDKDSLFQVLRKYLTVVEKGDYQLNQSETAFRIDDIIYDYGILNWWRDDRRHGVVGIHIQMVSCKSDICISRIKFLSYLPDLESLEFGDGLISTDVVKPPKEPPPPPPGVAPPPQQNR